VTSRDASPADDFEEGLLALSDEQCLLHLKAGAVGLIGLRRPGAPALRPVNYLLRENSILIRTGRGEILRSAQSGEPASFAISGIDPLEHTGWSVVATGRLSVLPADPALERLPLRAWAAAGRDHFVSLALDQVDGRHIPPGRGAR